jgi:predicted metal-dependent hydrolase
MTSTVLNTEPPYTIRHSKHARRLRLTVTPSKVEIVVPKRVRPRTVERFINQHHEWVCKKWQQMVKRIDSSQPISPKHYINGVDISFRGELFKIHITTENIKKPKLIVNEVFNVTLPTSLPPEKHEEATEKCIKKWLKIQLNEELEELFEIYGEKFGLQPKSFRIKQQKTLWGSCSAKGNININLYLAFLPFELLEYVVIHELCHLKHHNHSKNFWGLVESILPNYKETRYKLKNIHLPD